MSLSLVSATEDELKDLVAFEMGGELMAVPTRILREVLEPPRITRVPLAGVYSAGLMNVRGVVVPVTDLRPLFDMQDKPFDIDTRIVVLELALASGPVTIGLIAEKVHAVMSMDPATVQPVPSVGTRWPAQTIKGIGRWQDRFVNLIDLERVAQEYIGAAHADDAAA
ncbi:Chemotaxis protein CheW [Thalassovita gelatinovora]|uniref:Chemotaxis protein CheW n=1 Tax=Thalassovita gelatinovora TaxID=53501 RepID=A0A0P1FZC3_THAGE|nr:chemotaxis protein CheW [Thalassovita gelatinovora]QIZ80652.1 chemotaxis protein CheW [Thalassovita gelatinovora]CUH65214.1 Chemotaxis protein CheW [Thalassovita gelatinovora]SEQ87554.1 CheW protein [Thalassovita gelatinovora]